MVTMLTYANTDSAFLGLYCANGADFCCGCDTKHNAAAETQLLLGRVFEKGVWVKNYHILKKRKKKCE
jgi:hypothetical protein